MVTDVMTDQERIAIIHEVAAMGPLPIQSNEFTVAQFAAELGISTSKANYRLNKLCEEGILLLREGVLIGRHRCRVFRQSDTQKPPE